MKTMKKLRQKWLPLFSAALLVLCPISDSHAVVVVNDPQLVAETIQIKLNGIRSKLIQIRQYAQDIQTVRNTYEMLVNQVKLVETQLKNLKNLDFSSLDSSIDSLGEMINVLDNIEGIGQDVDLLRMYVKNIAPDKRISEILSPGVEEEQIKSLQQKRIEAAKSEALNDAMIDMTKKDAESVKKIIQKSRGADGALQALQANNELNAMLIKSINELKAIQMQQARLETKAKEEELTNAILMLEKRRELLAEKWQDSKEISTIPNFGSK